MPQSHLRLVPRPTPEEEPQARQEAPRDKRRSALAIIVSGLALTGTIALLTHSTPSPKGNSDNSSETVPPSKYSVRELQRMPSMRIKIPTGAGSEYAVKKVDPDIYRDDAGTTAAIERFVESEAPVDGILQAEKFVEVPIVPFETEPPK